MKFMIIIFLMIVLSACSSGNGGSVAEESTVETVAEVEGNPDGIATTDGGDIYVTEVDDGDLLQIEDNSEEGEESTVDVIYSPTDDSSADVPVSPDGITVISDGDEDTIYIADTGLDDGVTLDGEGGGGIYTYSESGGMVAIDDGGVIQNPAGLAASSDGELYVADQGSADVYRVTLDEANNVSSVESVLNGFESVEEPHGIALVENDDGSETLYVTDMGANSNNIIEIEIPADGNLSEASAADLTLDNSGGTGGDTLDTAWFDQPHGIAVNGNGTIFVTDENNNRVQVITKQGKVITLAGGKPGDADGSGDEAAFDSPRGIAVNSDGDVYVCDYGNKKMKKIETGL